MSEIIVHTDGACRGNPGAASIAYRIDGLPEIIEHAEKIGITTNNQAEYRAMVAALSAVSQLNLTDSVIECFSDSELMVKQIRGEYKVKDDLLRPHFTAIRELIRQIEQGGNDISFTAVRRDNNKRADELANMALDGLA